MVKISDIEIGSFPLLLAPMEDVSDPPFRALCKRILEHYGLTCGRKLWPRLARVCKTDSGDGYGDQQLGQLNQRYMLMSGAGIIHSLLEPKKY